VAPIANYMTACLQFCLIQQCNKEDSNYASPVAAVVVAAGAAVDASSLLFRAPRYNHAPEISCSSLQNQHQTSADQIQKALTTSIS